MRILLILAAIVALCGYFIKTVFFREGGSKAFLASGSNIAGALPSKDSPPADGAFTPTSEPKREVGKLGKPPEASRLVRFEHRHPPLPDQVPIAGDLGCVLTVDDVTRSVFIAGPVEGVEMLTRYFEEIDTPAGSCAVHAWAVYVDNTAQKGFDLVAALASVADVDLEAVVGNGGMTLDVGADKITAALTVVCDGSSVEVVQRPHVHLEQGVTAKIESLQEVPLPTTSVSQGFAQTSVQYRKVGLQLEVIPYFLGGDRLRLGVVQTNGLLGNNVKIGPDEVPIIQSQTVSSTIEMSIGQTVVLGGVTSYRQKTVHGILRDTVEKAEGVLYVVLSTTSNIPRAVPVRLGVANPLPASSVPLLPPVESGRGWIDSALLPVKGWKKQESDFIKSR